MNGLESVAIAARMTRGPRAKRRRSACRSRAADSRPPSAVASRNAPVPECAAPNPRTRPRGVFMFVLNPSACSRATHTTIVSTTEPTSVANARNSRSFGSKPCAGVPDEMPDAAEHVMQKRPGVAEQNKLPEPRRKKSVHEFELARRPRHREQPPGEQQRAEIERAPGDPMHDRHHHRRRQAIDRNVRRERALIFDAWIPPCRSPTRPSFSARLIRSSTPDQPVRSLRVKRNYSSKTRPQSVIRIAYLRKRRRLVCQCVST